MGRLLVIYFLIFILISYSLQAKGSRKKRPKRLHRKHVHGTNLHPTRNVRPQYYDIDALAAANFINELETPKNTTYMPEEQDDQKPEKLVPAVQNYQNESNKSSYFPEERYPEISQQIKQEAPLYEDDVQLTTKAPSVEDLFASNATDSLETNHQNTPSVKQSEIYLNNTTEDQVYLNNTYENETYQNPSEIMSRGSGPTDSNNGMNNNTISAQNNTIEHTPPQKEASKTPEEPAASQNTTSIKIKNDGFFFEKNIDFDKLPRYLQRFSLFFATLQKLPSTHFILVLPLLLEKYSLIGLTFINDFLLEYALDSLFTASVLFIFYMISFISFLGYFCSLKAELSKLRNKKPIEPEHKKPSAEDKEGPFSWWTFGKKGSDVNMEKTSVLK